MNSKLCDKSSIIAKKHNMKISPSMLSIFSCGPPESVKIDLARKRETTEYIWKFKYLVGILEKEKIVILRLHTSDTMNSIIKEAFWGKKVDWRY